MEDLAQGTVKRVASYVKDAAALLLSKSWDMAEYTVKFRQAARLRLPDPRRLVDEVLEAQFPDTAKEK